MLLVVVVFRITDYHNKGFVTRMDVQQMAYIAETLLRRYNFGTESMASPEEVCVAYFLRMLTVPRL